MVRIFNGIIVIGLEKKEWLKYEENIFDKVFKDFYERFLFKILILFCF